MALLSQRSDFFISYNHADQGWAEWIAWTLEQEGYKVVVQAWDFRPGSNFVVEMQEGLTNADRVIAIISPEFMASTFTAPEWAAAFANDPTGQKRSLIPVRVRDVRVEGLLGQVVRIDLVGLDPDAARSALLSGLQLGRSKPITPPNFPGFASGLEQEPNAVDPVVTGAVFQQDNGALGWQLIDLPIEPKWRPDDQGRSADSTIIELHLLPHPKMRIEVRRLATLRDDLGRAMRESGLASMTEGVDGLATDQMALAQTTGLRDRTSGLMVTRDGQRGGWFGLPRDLMGPILDPSDIQSRIAALIRMLVDLPIEPANHYAVAAGLTNIGMLTIGSQGDLQGRSSMSLPFTGRGDIKLHAEDMLSAATLHDNAAAVSEEIVARLVARLSTR